MFSGAKRELLGGAGLLVMLIFAPMLAIIFAMGLMEDPADFLERVRDEMDEGSLSASVASASLRPSAGLNGFSDFLETQKGLGKSKGGIEGTQDQADSQAEEWQTKGGKGGKQSKGGYSKNHGNWPAEHLRHDLRRYLHFV